MDSDRRLDQLFASLPNFERTRTISTEWSLDTMTELLAALPVPATHTAPTRWLQVGGSKGKGTTTHYLESLARNAGLRTGVFTSPHITHVTERVRVDGQPVTASRLVAALEPILALAQERGLAPSFFEVMTLAAVQIFRDLAVDLAVLEVGLGGRLDATTAVPVDGSILTQIELEHTDLLGCTVEAIATEKSFVIRPDRPVWFTREPRTEGVFAARAAAVGAHVQAAWSWDELVATADGFRGVLVEPDGAREPFVLPGASAFELPALALVVPALRWLFPALAIGLEPVARPTLPGRFEIVATQSGPLVLDGAHTKGSMRLVAEELRRRYPESVGRVAVLFATAADKQWREGLSELSPVVDRVFLTELPGTAGASPAEVADFLCEQGIACEVVAGPEEGLDALSRYAAGTPGSVRLVTGSFYLLGAVRDRVAPATDPDEAE